MTPPSPVPAAPVATEPGPTSSPAATFNTTAGPSVPPSSDPGPGAFAVSPAPTANPAPATSTGPSRAEVAALPPDGITHRAIPRGGYQHRPAYPSSARRLGIQGTTLLSVLVAEDGRVADVVVKQSAGHPDLDQAATDAVRRWRFEPARRGSEAVAVWVLLPVEFRLR